MKTILLLFLATTLFTLPLRAEDSFPKVGTSYHVFYTTKPDGAFCPSVVRILKRGSGGWTYVEAKKGPKSNSVSFWLNFDLLLSATEINQAEQVAPSDGEKPPK